MTANASSARMPPGPGPKPRGRILYSFLIALAAMGLLPLGITATKLIGTNREALVTSQQEVQLQVATAAVRQLNAGVEAIKAQMGRLAEAIGAQPARGGGDAGRAIAESGLIPRLLGQDMVLLRYTPRAGRPAEASQAGLTVAGDLKAAIDATVAAAREGRAAVSDPVPVPAEGGVRSVLVASVPVGAGPEAGVLSGVVDFDLLWDPIVGGRRAAYLIYALDRDGVLIAAQDEDGVLERGDAVKVAREVRAGGGHSAMTTEFSVTVDGRPLAYIASFDTTGQGWSIFVQIPKAQAYATATQMVETTLFWASLAVGLALVLAFFLANTVTRPIKVLAAGTEAFARGELDHRVQVGSHNELGALALTFNQMAEQIQSYIKRLSHAAALNNELFMGTVKALAEAIDEKDPYTRGHSDRVNRYAIILARQMSLNTEEVRRIHIASLFHDIGKIGIEDKILRKPAVLTDEEYQVMKQHPEKGAQMLSKIRAMRDIIPGMRFHHERWDGTGYPLGLKGEQIPLAARIVAVADAFDAMTTNRPYQKAMPFDKAIARLFELSDRAFDRKVVGAFSEAYKSGVFREPQAAVAEEL